MKFSLNCFVRSLWKLNIFLGSIDENLIFEQNVIEFSGISRYKNSRNSKRKHPCMSFSSTMNKFSGSDIFRLHKRAEMPQGHFTHITASENLWNCGNPTQIINRECAGEIEKLFIKRIGVDRLHLFLRNSS